MKEFAKDYLTGLISRQGLYDWYDEIRKNTTLQLMFVDLDNFKGVNDTYGHNVGDVLLVKVAQILQNCIDDSICARIGGDEFVVIIKGKYERRKIEETAQSIIVNISKKKGIEEISTDISASIGLLLDEKKGEPLNDILFKIDAAMYQAKQNGRACYVVFNDIADTVFEEMQMERHQTEALQLDEFKILFKPIINAQTSKIFMTELYLEWEMSDGRKYGQERFLEVFEKNGFIKPLNLWVVEEVCMYLSQFHHRKGMEGKMAVRVSKLLLLEATFTSLLLSILNKYDVKPWEICLEIEESCFGRGCAGFQGTLKELEEQGFHIALIEVGVDFSSLKYWDRLTLEFMCLNQEYLHNAMSSFKGRQIVKTLLSMGHDLKTKVVADGIDDREDVDFLTNCGCNAISGSFYTEPLKEADYEEYMTDRLVYQEQKTMFHFQGDFASEDHSITAKTVGSGLSLAPGITKNLGSIYFQGSSEHDNVLELSGVPLAEESYTIAFWLKPTGKNDWTSAVYARFLGGFVSFCPYAGSGHSIFRISEDADANGFHDILGREIPLDKWSFICITYDASAGVMGYYMNGRKIGFLRDVPIMSGCRQIIVGGDPFQNSYQGYLSALLFSDNVKAEDEIKELYETYINNIDFYGEKEDFWRV